MGKRIGVTFDQKTYEKIELLAGKKGVSMSEVVRDWAIQGLNGSLTEENMDFIVPIIREQLKGIVNAGIERLASMTAKTCVQAGAAAYLSAEAINKFVPDQEREDFLKAYEAARRKAVKYMQGKSDFKSQEA